MHPEMKRSKTDLHPAIKDYVYHPKFHGSFSLKDVLAALVPYMTYEGMEIAAGKAPSNQ